MKKAIKSWVLAAAVASVPLLGWSTSADAQYRIANDGHALDANNRLGSGGINGQSSANAPYLVPGNDIVDGNVTAGRQFRGAVPYRDPRAFTGYAPGMGVDAFIRQSSGVDSRLAETVQPFYGASRNVAPPAGYTQTSTGSGAYVPSNQPISRAVGDTRMGSINLASPQVALPQPGELLLPGPVDPTIGQTYISASPLYGIRQLGPNDISGLTVNTQYNPVGGELDSASIKQMRQELIGGAQTTGPQQNQSTNPNNNANGASNDNNSQQPDAAAPGAAGGAGAANQPIGQPIIQQPLSAQNPYQQQPIAQAVNPAAGNLNTDQYTRQVFLPTPQQQSSAYAELLNRYQEGIKNHTLSDEEAARQFAAIQRAQKEAVAGKTPGAPAAPGAPAVRGANPAAPGAVGAVPPPANANAKPGEESTLPGGIPDYAKRGAEALKHAGEDNTELSKPAPVKISSLASGIKGRGLAAIMKNAEELMRQGKYTLSLDQYDQAEQVAPNNPFIKLGRANAELGALYYARAEAHLRDVFAAHPETLMGQYDLSKWLGDDRLQVLVRDLKEIAVKNPTEARPLFLLAYIAYNTGHAETAAAYIDLADKRSDGKDPFYKLLRDNWSLPLKATTPTTQPAINK